MLYHRITKQQRQQAFLTGQFMPDPKDPYLDDMAAWYPFAYPQGGLVLDVSGNGNHFSQSLSDAVKPTHEIAPHGVVSALPSLDDSATIFHVNTGIAFTQCSAFTWYLPGQDKDVDDGDYLLGIGEASDTSVQAMISTGRRGDNAAQQFDNSLQLSYHVGSYRYQTTYKINYSWTVGKWLHHGFTWGGGISFARFFDNSQLANDYTFLSNPTRTYTAVAIPGIAYGHTANRFADTRFWRVVIDNEYRRDLYEQPYLYVLPLKRTLYSLPPSQPPAPAVGEAMFMNF